MQFRQIGFLAGALCSTMLLASTPACADRMNVRVRWEAGAGGSAAGYRIHMRYANDFYGEPLDVGLPEAEESGAMSAVVKSVDGSQDYAFAVTAYAADGTESSLSNEGLLRAADVVRPSCNELRCDGNGCVPAAAPDRVACFEGDPCAVGVCAGGTCAVSADAPVPLELGVGAFKIAPAGRKQKRLAGRAVLPLGTAVAEPFADAKIEVRDASSGALVYLASVSGSDFGLKRRQSTFVYPKKRRVRAPAGANGLKHASVRVGTGGSVLTVRAASVDLARLAGDDALMWVVRLGDRCARAVDVACGPMRRGRMRCR